MKQILIKRIQMYLKKEEKSSSFEFSQLKNKLLSQAEFLDQKNHECVMEVQSNPFTNLKFARTKFQIEQNLGVGNNLDLACILFKENFFLIKSELSPSPAHNQDIDILRKMHYKKKEERIIKCKKKIDNLFYNSQGKIEKYSLRGGGCCLSKVHPTIEKLQHNSDFKTEIPFNFSTNLFHNLNIIIKKAPFASDMQQKEEILIALQWFNAIKEHFNSLCSNYKTASSVFDIMFSALPDLLKSLVTYIRISGFLCLQVLQIINEMCRVIFTFFMKNQKRFMDSKDQQKLDLLIADFETQLEIESSDVWVGGAEFEIAMIKAVVQCSPHSSDEGEKLLTTFLGGLLKSVLTMSPSEALIDSLIEGVKFLFKQNLGRNQKKQYELYYFFQTLKWHIIELLKQNVQPQKLLVTLQNSYQNYIENSKEQLISFCWVKFITDLISYRPYISKQMLTTNPTEQQNIWNQFIKQKIINQCFFNKNMGRLVLFQDLQNQENEQLHYFFKKLGFKQFQKFHELLLNNLQYSPIYLLNFKNKIELELKKIDYFQELFLGNFQLGELIESLNNYLLGLKQLFEKIKQDFETWMKLNNEYDEKQKNDKLEEIIESTQDLILQSFQACSILRNINKAFRLYFGKARLIIHKISQENTIKEEIEKAEKIFSESFKENLQDNEQSLNLLIALECNLTRINPSENYSQIITQNEEIILTFFETLSKLQKSCKEILKQLEMIKENNFNKQVVCTINDLQEVQFSEFEQLEKIITEINYISNDKRIIQELFNKNKFNLDTDIYYYQTKYWLISLLNQLKEQKEITKEMQIFFKKNQKVLQNLNQELSSITNDQNLQEIFYDQYRLLKDFFQASSEYINSRSINNYVFAENIISLLKLDLEKLEQIESFNQNQTFRVIHRLTAIAIKYMQIYVATLPQRTTLISDFIIDEYIKANEDLKEKKPIATQEQIEEKMKFPQKSKTDLYDNFQQKYSYLQQQIESQTLICQNILNIVLDSINLNKNIQLQQIQLSFKLNQPTKFVQKNEHEYIIRKILQNYFDQFKKCDLELNTTKPVQQTLSGKFPGILVEFCDLLNFRCKKMTNLNQNIYQKVIRKIPNVFEKAQDFAFSKNYKTIQCFVISLISIQTYSSELEVIQFCQDISVQIWASEKDEQVKSLLQHSEYQEMEKKLFSINLQSFSQRLQSHMEEKFNKLRDLEQQIYQEGDPSIRKKYQDELKQEQLELEDYLNNINDMASKLDIGIQSLKQIKNDLALLKQKLEKLELTINQIGDDVRKLKGKTFIELLNMRKRKVLEQMQLNSLNSIYIPLKCQEWNPVSTEKKEEPSFFMDHLSTGIINQFLEESTQDVLLIRGVAGCGKSRTAGKIEELLWQNVDQVKQSQWFPIFVSLPTLKEPKFNLIEQSLESAFYSFDKIQVKEFKDALKQQKIKILLILDSYDEMKQDCIQQNLIHTNKFKQNLSESQSIQESIKVIIITRTEILTSNSYRTWFYGDDISTLKEIELLQFSEEQKSKYLEEFILLQMKKEFLEIYSFLKQILREQINFQEFWGFWEKIKIHLQLNTIKSHMNEDFFMTKEQINEIIQIVKEEKSFQKINQDQIINLQKGLMDLWSIKKFEKLIDSSQIQNLLTTPFMMEIVVQVLPSMSYQQQEISFLKNEFINNYVFIKQKTQLEQQLIIKYKNQSLALEGLPQITNVDIEPSDDLTFKGSEIWDRIYNQTSFKNFTIFTKITKNDLQNIEEINIVIQALKAKRLNVYDFYATFTGFYHQKQIKKQQDLGNMVNFDSFIIDLVNFSQSLAIELTIRELSQIKYVQKGQLELKFKLSDKNQSDDWQDVYFNDFNENGQYKKLIRSCILLISPGGNYQFIHKSIQEFYVGQFLLKHLDEFEALDQNDIEQKILSLSSQGFFQKLESNDFSSKQVKLLTTFELFCSKIKTSLLNQDYFNLSTDNYKGVMTIIKEEIKQKKNIGQKLKSILKLSQFLEIFVRASSNSLYILGFINEYLGNQCLRNLRITDIDLDGINFYESDLSNSQFKNINLKSCNFNKATLQNCIWKNITCDDAITLRDYSSSSEIIQIYFSLDGSLLTSIAQDGIKVWNVKEGALASSLTKSNLKNMNLSYFDEITDEITIFKAKFSSDQTILAIQWNTSKQNNSLVQMINFQQAISQGCFTSRDEGIEKFRISHDKNFIAYFCHKSTNIVIFDIHDNKKQFLEFEYEVTKILFSYNGEMLISCHLNFCYIVLWDYKEGKQLKLLNGHRDYVNDIVLQPNGSTFVSYALQELILWDSQKHKQIYLEQINIQVQKIKFLSNGQNLILLSEKDQQYRIFNIKTRKMRIIDYPLKFIISNKFLVREQNEGQIEIFDIGVEKIIQVIKSQSKLIKEIIYSPQNQIFATIYDNENAIYLQHKNQEKLINQFSDHQSKVNSLGFSPDGLIIYSYERNSIVLWDIKGGKKLYNLDVNEKIEKIEFAKQGEFLFLIGNCPSIWYFKEDQLIILNDLQNQIEQQFKDLDIQPKKALLKYCFKEIGNEYDYWMIKFKDLIYYIHENSVKKLKFSPDRSFLALINKENSFKVWNMKRNKLFFRWDNVTNFHFSLDSLILYIDNYIELMSVNLLQETNEIQVVYELDTEKYLFNNEILVQVFDGFVSVQKISDQTTDSFYFGCGCHLSPNLRNMISFNQNEIKVWNIKDFKLMNILSGHQSEIAKHFFSNNGDILATFENDNNLILWNLVQMKLIGQSLQHKEADVQFSPNDQILALFSHDKSITLFNTSDFTKIMIQANLFYDGDIKEICVFSPDNQFFAFYNQKAIHLLHIEKEYIVQILQEEVIKIKFSQDSSILFSFEKRDYYLIFMDLIGNHQARSFRYQKQSIISNDDQYIACQGYLDIKLFETNFGKEIFTFKGHKKTIQNIAFSPDNNYLASCSSDFNIFIWNIRYQYKQVSFIGHDDFINRLQFSPDSKILVSSCLDLTVRIWNIQKEKLKLKISKIYDLLAEGSIYFYRNGQILTLEDKCEIIICNVRGKQQLYYAEGKNSILSIIGFRPIDELLYINDSLKKNEISALNIKTLIKAYSIQEQNIINKSLLIENDRIMILIFEDNTLKVYDILNHKTVAVFKEHQQTVNCVVISPDKRIMATCSDDGTARLTYIQNIQEKENQKNNLILSSYITFGLYVKMTAQDCQLRGAQIQSKTGQDLKILFLQKGANED